MYVTFKLVNMLIVKTMSVLWDVTLCRLVDGSRDFPAMRIARIVEDSLMKRFFRPNRDGRIILK